jgi:drug/metabolite transporter (DMT)-like permease
VNTAASTAEATGWLTPVELLVLGAVWGSSFLFMRIATQDFGPLALVEVRLILGALVLLPLLWRSLPLLSPAHWAKLAFVGAINSAIPFVLFAWGAQRAPAGIGAISNATAVMFTALIAFAFFGEHISRRRALGLACGFIGVIVLASGKTSGGSVWQAALAGTFAAFLYGVGGNFVRRHFADLPPGTVAAATLTCAAVLLAPFAIVAWPAEAVPVKSWISVVLLGVLCTGFAYLLYYRLIYRIGAPRASTVTYLVPLFGVIWAWVVLGEPLTLSMAIAGALILGGVALSQQRAASR